MDGFSTGSDAGDGSESASDQSMATTEIKENEGLEFMNESIKSFENLQSLELCDPSDDFLLYLMKALAQEAPSTLRKITLSMDNDHDERLPESLPGIDIFLASEQSSSILEVELSCHAISLKGIERLIAGLSTNRSVETLRLTALDGISSDGAEMLSQFFHSNSSGNIKHVDICVFDGVRSIWKDLF